LDRRPTFAEEILAYVVDIAAILIFPEPIATDDMAPDEIEAFVVDILNKVIPVNDETVNDEITPVLTCKDEIIADDIEAFAVDRLFIVPDPIFAVEIEAFPVLIEPVERAVPRALM